MSGMITEHNLFKPKSSKAETRADITNYTARAIVGAEAELREAKTARLRQARLENEAELSVLAVPAAPRRARVTAPRRARPSL
jgi:hypothetical protein